MLKTTKILLTSATLISLSANLAFATNKPLCVVDKYGELVGVATQEQAAAACQSADSSLAFAAALSGPATEIPKDICNSGPIVVDPIPAPDPIVPPCPQPTCDQKLGVVKGNLDRCEASVADFSLKIEEQNKTIESLNATIQALQCRINPRAKGCRKAPIKTNKNKNNANSAAN